MRYSLGNAYRQRSLMERLKREKAYGELSVVTIGGTISEWDL